MTRSIREIKARSIGEGVTNADFDRSIVEQRFPFRDCLHLDTDSNQYRSSYDERGKARAHVVQVSRVCP
jgi:hypothetical protein